MMLLPNLVIIGAPRCGTSSVFQWLIAHPHACGASVKDSFYLMDREFAELRRCDAWYRHGLDGYAALFSRCGDARVRCDATALYLYSETAREVLAGLPTAPIVVALLREPARRAHSWFQYQRLTRGFMDRRLSFAAYVEVVRAGDAAILARACHSDLIRYEARQNLEYSRYARWLEPWIAALGPARVITAVFEQVVTEPREFMQDLAGRLGLDPGFYDGYVFRRHNPVGQRRLPRLHRWAHQAATGFGLRLGHGWLRRAYEATTLQGTTAELPEEDRAAISDLADGYAEDNRALVRLTGLDTSCWGASA